MPSYVKLTNVKSNVVEGNHLMVTTLIPVATLGASGYQQIA